MGKALLTIGRILGNAGEPAVHPVAGSASGKGRIPAEQVAGNVRRIFPAARKRPAIAATGGQLHLRDGSIWKDANRFQAALPAEICSVGVTVIENVPLPIDFFNTAVIVPAVKHGLVCRFIGINMQIAITDDYTGKSERAKRRAAAGIAEFMVRDRGVDEIIGIPCLPNGGCLKEREIRKAGSGSIWRAGSDCHRLSSNRQHIRLQNRYHGAAAVGICRRTEACIQVDCAPLKEYAGVKLGRVALPFAEAASVRMVDIPVELIPSGRGVTDGHRDHRQLVENIVEVVSSICPTGHVRRKKQHVAILVGRIIRPGIDHTLIPPVGQIVHRRRPTDVVIRAVCVAAEPVVGAEDIHTPVKHMGLSVGDILPGGQIGIESLLFHTCLPQ